MMKTPFTSKGDILLEALIGLVLLGILGGGMLFAGGRVIATQRDTNMQNKIVLHARQQMNEPTKGLQKLCAGSVHVDTLPGPSLTWTVKNCDDLTPAKVKVSIPGILADAIEVSVLPPAQLTASETHSDQQ